MNSAFTTTGRLEKTLSKFLLGALLTLPFVAFSQTIGTYKSPATVTVPPGLPPQVNATNFVNNGVWNINTSYGSTPYSPLPYQTLNTRNYTNTGSMTGSLGWEFDFGPTRGSRNNPVWSANFYNGNNGTVYAQDGYLFVANNIAIGQFPLVSYLLISATNVVNQGTLVADANGEIIINGSGVNLSRSGVGINPVTSVLSGVVQQYSPTNFIPDTAIYDVYWKGGTNRHTFIGSSVWDGTTVGSFSVAGVGFAGPPCNTTVSGTVGSWSGVYSDSYTNTWNPGILITTNSQGVPDPPTLIYSNEVRQAMFVYVTDPNVFPSIRFGSQITPTNYFLPMIVQLLAQSTNIVTQALQDSTLYVMDDLAAVGTNGALMVNLVLNPYAQCTSPTFRPDSVAYSRSDISLPGNFFIFSTGTTGFGTPAPDFYYENNFSNRVSNGRADFYWGLVDNLAAEPPPGFSQTNAPGKVLIYARNLNLSKTRMTGSSLVQIAATNLVSSSGAIIDCQQLSYELGSTNGTLNFTNLTVPFVDRLHGPVYEWSGLWTNYQVNVFTNYVTNSVSGTPPYIRSDITNVVEVDLAATMVDASGLSSTIPEIVLNLKLHSTNIFIGDLVTVTNAMLFDGKSLTIQSGAGLALNTGLQNWTGANAPTLRYFTNNGAISVPNVAHFGDDTATNYAAFVNNGTITAGSEFVNSAVYQAGGSQTVTADFAVTTSAGTVQNGTITSGNNVQFTAGTLKFLNSSVTVGNQLNFNVTTSLYDAGGSSSNVLTCNDGFDLPAMPALGGNLLGTKLETIAPMFAAVDHYWPGKNLGASNAGYTNNEAVGQLALNEGSDSEFIFHATSASNALYVDLLDLSQCPDFLDPTVLTIDPNFVIYYAAAKLPASFTVPPNSNGIPQEAEEYLNGKLGGHLVWVPTYAGANSSVYVLINGQSVLVNKALRYSKIIDSNGNGIPNFYDANPFNTVPVVVSASLMQTNPPSANKLAVSWTAAPNKVYQVQYRTSYISGSWLPLKNYTNNASSSVTATVWDTNAVTGQRYYRVSQQ